MNLTSCKFRIIPRLEDHDSIVSAVQTLWGRTALVALFDAILMLWAPKDGPLMALSATMCAFSGRYRYHALAFATLLNVLLRPFWFDQSVPVIVSIQEGLYEHTNFGILRYITLLAFFLFAALIIDIRRRFPGAPLCRRPLVSLTILFFALVLIAHSSILHGSCRVFLWSFVYAFSFYFWYLAYALADQSASDRSPLWVQLATLHAFWSSSVVPLGKGASYLRRTEARTPRDLAITQIKGVKILVWSIILSIVLQSGTHVAYNVFHVPTFDQAFSAQIHGKPYPWYQCWESVVVDLFLGVLEIAAGAGIFIACGRIAGFQMLRNTYKPLVSGTVLEFWNRYFYYFKETLVDFFFYPSFTRYGKKNRMLRMSLATFAAAGAGNILFHFVTCIMLVEKFGLLAAVVGFGTNAFYCVFLSAAIIASQLKTKERGRKNSRLYSKIVGPVVVILFFCLLRPFNFGGDNYYLWMQPFSSHWMFLVRLFGFR